MISHCHLLYLFSIWSSMDFNGCSFCEVVTIIKVVNVLSDPQAATGKILFWNTTGPEIKLLSSIISSKDKA